MRRAFWIAVVALMQTACVPPEWAANAILYPHKRAVSGVPPIPYRDVVFQSDGIRLEGWFFPSASPVRKGLIVYLHGVADNRTSGVGIAQRFTPQGYDVLAYDSRAHGRSGGDYCTYGFHERRDLSRALDALGARDAVLFGSSLGASVALQAAPAEPRIRGIIAQSAFADLREIVTERAGKFGVLFSRRDVSEALAVAERRASFRAEEVSPRALAGGIRVPVLLLHGERDRETAARHSRRIYDALPGQKRLLIVPGAGHNDVLGRPEAWREIQSWLDALEAGPGRTGDRMSQWAASSPPS